MQYWNGSAWATVLGGSVSNNNKVWKKITFAALTTTKIRVLANASPDGYSRLTELEAWGPAAPPRTNFALTANGGVASASSTYTPSQGAGYDANPGGANNGNRSGKVGANSAAWTDNTQNTWGDWLQIDFNGSKTIDEIDVFTIQDAYMDPIEPTEATTFSVYGLTAFEVQYWNGSAWATVPGGSVSNNNKVWKKIAFAPLTTTKIRVLTNASPDGYSRLTELEAWGPAAPPRTNFALTANGAVASSSSTYMPNQGAGYDANPGGANNGNRNGNVGANSTAWTDNTQNTWPDWLQIEFNGNKTIDEIDVFTLQDAYMNPSEPTEAMTFGLYGLTGFEMQYWNGSAWATVPGGSVSNNNKVWKKIAFAALTTTKIRVLTNASPDGYSRITEVEVWGTAP